MRSYEHARPHEPTSSPQRGEHESPHTRTRQTPPYGIELCIGHPPATDRHINHIARPTAGEQQHESRTEASGRSAAGRATEQECSVCTHEAFEAEPAHGGVVCCPDSDASSGSAADALPLQTVRLTCVLSVRASKRREFLRLSRARSMPSRQIAQRHDECCHRIEPHEQMLIRPRKVLNDAPGVARTRAGLHDLDVRAAQHDRGKARARSHRDPDERSAAREMRCRTNGRGEHDAGKQARHGQRSVEIIGQ